MLKRDQAHYWLDSNPNASVHHSAITSVTIEMPFGLFMRLAMQPKYLTDGIFFHILVAECEKQKWNNYRTSEVDMGVSDRPESCTPAVFAMLHCE